jgi:hypothetical protein
LAALASPTSPRFLDGEALRSARTKAVRSCSVNSAMALEMLSWTWML